MSLIESSVGPAADNRTFVSSCSVARNFSTRHRRALLPAENGAASTPRMFTGEKSFSNGPDIDIPNNLRGFDVSKCCICAESHPKPWLLNFWKLSSVLCLGIRIPSLSVGIGQVLNSTANSSPRFVLFLPQKPVQSDTLNAHPSNDDLFSHVSEQIPGKGFTDHVVPGNRFAAPLPRRIGFSKVFHPSTVFLGRARESSGRRRFSLKFSALC